MHFHSRIGLAKPAPYRMARGTASVAVNSIGTSGVSLIPSLRRFVPLPESDITALILQAPSLLITGADRFTADSITAALRESGLDCSVLDGDCAIEDGVGEHEIALDVHEFACMRAIVREVMYVLGIEQRSALQLVCKVPPVLLSGVSIANVHALRSRFVPLGAGIQASHVATARFDLYLGYCAPALREAALARLRRVANGGGHFDPEAGILSDIDADNAEYAWQELRQLAVPLRVVNRDFARYALSLQHGEDTPELRRCLMQLMGMPESTIRQILRSLPVVFKQGLRYSESAAALRALQAVGARGSSEPLAFQRFSLSLDPVREPAPLLPILCELGELREADALDILRSPAPRLPGPFTVTQARWFAHELRRAGGSVQLESSL